MARGRDGRKTVKDTPRAGKKGERRLEGPRVTGEGV